jgi:CubicO group peptidase (beta-lactamase class C family)
MKTHRLSCLCLALLLFVALPIVLLPVSAGDPAPPRSMAAVLKPFVDRHALAGAVVLVADKDKVLALEALGYSDVRNMTPMEIDALFWIASQSKPITAAALMMLVDEGKVRLDDPVEKFLPELGKLWLERTRDDDLLVLRKPRERVTVRHILSHTSGMPFKSDLERPTLDLLPLRVGVGSYAMTPLLFEPGTKYQYSNAGINTAGRIIEVVSRMPYEEFLDKRLFGPLGMKDTTFWPNAAQLRRLAKSYRPNKAGTDLEETHITQLKYPLDDRTRQPMPAGGLFSTASDLGRFCRMVLNGGTFEGKRYLSEDAVKHMTSRQTGKKIAQSYGLGWSTGGGGFGHGGAYSTNMHIDTRRGLITVFMVQHAGFPNNGGESSSAFRKAAEARFGNLKR